MDQERVIVELPDDPDEENDKKITREEWEKRLSDIKIRKEDMNKLVMNFLVTEAYIDAAEKFKKETGIEPDIGLATIMDRAAVKQALLLGNIEDAIRMVNDLNSEILETNVELDFHLQQQRMIELIRQGKKMEAMEFVRKELAPRVVKHHRFLYEMGITLALLVFEDAPNSPAGYLLKTLQRLWTANEANRAILTSLNRDKDPMLSGLLKMLLSAQYQLRVDEKVYFPQMHDLYTAELEY